MVALPLQTDTERIWSSLCIYTQNRRFVGDSLQLLPSICPKISCSASFHLFAPLTAYTKLGGKRVLDNIKLVVA